VFEDFECGFGAVSDVHVIAVTHEHPLQRLAEGILVFNYEQSFCHCALPEDWLFTAVMPVSDLHALDVLMK
jgi:hypothetical protein